MEILKRTLSAFLALVLVCGMLPMPAGATEQELTEITETVPATTAPAETVPETSAPAETVPATTAPQETVSETTVPEETVPETTVPEETVSETTAPAETVPETTAPAETVPETTVPEETEPEVTEDTANEDAAFSLETEGGSYYFTTFEDLKTLAGMTFTDYAYAYYEGAEPLVFDEDLTIPEKLNVFTSYDDSQFVISEGISVEVNGCISVDSLIVNGYLLVNFGREPSVSIQKELIVNGAIDNSYGSIWIRSDAYVEGGYKVFGTKPYWMYGGIYTFDEMKTAVLAAHNDSDEWIHFPIMSTRESSFVIDESITIPSNYTFGCYGENPIVIAEDCTLTLYGKNVYIEGPMTVEGTLVNNFTNKWSDPVEVNSPITFTETGSYSGTGTLFISKTDFSSWQDAIIGLDESIFQVEESSKGWYLTYIGSADSELWQDEYGSYHFTTFEALKQLSEMTFEDYTDAYYEGEDTLYISEDLALPENLMIRSNSYDFAMVVESGVTMTAYELYVDSLTVDGSLTLEYAEVYADLTVNGELYLNGYLRLDGLVAVTGDENVYYNEYAPYFDCYCTTMDELQTVLAVIEYDTTGWSYDMTLEAGEDGLVIDTDVTLPGTSYFYIEGENTVTLAQGCTLTMNNWQTEIRGAFRVEGNLVNNTQYSYLLESGVLTITETGSYTGTGTLEITKDSYSAWQDAVIGLDEEDVLVGESDDCWSLTLVRHELWQDADGDYHFHNQEELRQLAEMTFETETWALYDGKEPLVIDEDLTLPDNLIVERGYGDSTVVIGEDATVDMYRLYAENLTVEGGLIIRNHAGVYQNLNVSGYIQLDGDLWVDGFAAIEGSWNVFYDYNTPTLEFRCVSFEELQAALTAIEEDTTAWNYFLILKAGEDGITIDTDVTIPYGVDFRIDSDYPVTVAEGCTLNLYCEYAGFWGPVVLEGNLVNDAQYSYLYDTTITVTETGSYTGTSTLDINKEYIYDWQSALVGVDESHFWVEDTDYAWYVTYTEDPILMGLEGIKEQIALGETYIYLNDDIYLEENFVIPADVTLDMNGHTFTVAKGRTFTVKGQLLVSRSAWLQVDKGGKLVNEGRIFTNANNTDSGQINVEGSYTHRAKARLLAYYAKETWNDQTNQFESDYIGAMDAIQGIHNKYITLYAETQSEDALCDVLQMQKDFGYAGSDVYFYNEYGYLSLWSSFDIPKNANVYLQQVPEGSEIYLYDAELEINGQITVSGNLDIPANVYMILNGGMTVNKGGVVNFLGTLGTNYDGVSNVPVNAGGKILPSVYTLKLAQYDYETGEVSDISKKTLAVDQLELINSDLEVLVDVASYDGSDPALQAVSWTSSNKALVDASKIQYHGDGLFTIPFEENVIGSVKLTATALDGSRKSTFVTVNVYYLDSAKKLTAETTVPEIGLQQGEEAEIIVSGDAVIDPQYLEFTSSNEKVLTVDEYGTITGGEKTGTAKITAKIIDDPMKRSVSVDVKVIVPQTDSLTLTHDVPDQEKENAVDLDMADLYGESYTFTIYPEAIDSLGDWMELTKTSLKWTTSDRKIATVKANDDGTADVTINANVFGQCVITAETTDLAKVKQTISIVVRDYSPRLDGNRINLNPALAAGAKMQLLSSYDNDIVDVQFREASYGLNVSYAPYDANTDIKQPVEYGVLTITAADHLNDPVKNGTLKTILDVTCVDGKTYSFDLNVAVKEVLPTVTVKPRDKVNLFYPHCGTELEVTVKGGTLGREDDGDAIVLTQTEDFESSYRTNMFSVECSIHSTNTLREGYAKNVNYNPDTKGEVEVWCQGYTVPVVKDITLSTTVIKPELRTNPSANVINKEFTGNKITLGLEYNESGRFVSFLCAEEDITVRDSRGKELTNVELTVADDGLITIDFGNKPYQGTLNLDVRPRNDYHPDEFQWNLPVTVPHKVTVNTKLPTAKLENSTLKLYSVFDKIPAKTTLTLGNMDIARITDFVSTAREGSSAYEEAQKITITYNEENGTVKAILNDSSIKAGTYTFKATPYILNNDGEEVKLEEAVTLKINVSAAQPKVKFIDYYDGKTLSNNTLKFNIQLAGLEGEHIHPRLGSFDDIPCGSIYNMVSYFKGDDAHSEVAFDGGECTFIRLNENAKKGDYTYTLIPVVQYLVYGDENEWGDEEWYEAELKPIDFTVKAYDKDVSVSLSSKGKLDITNPNNGIIYTPKVSNSNFGPSDITLAKGDDLFDLQRKYSEGAYTYSLTLKDGVAYSTNETYEVQFEYHFGDKTFLSLREQKLKVTKSTMKMDAPRTVTFYQSQNQPLKVEMKVASPEGAYIRDVENKGVAINASATSKELLAALTGSGIAYRNGRTEAIASIKLGNTAGLKVGSTYKLVLNVYPHEATDNYETIKPIQVTVNVKIAK